MKIIDVKTFIVGNPWKNWVFIKLYTDEGITGLGEATGGLSTRPHQADIEELARLVKTRVTPINSGTKCTKGVF